MAEGNTARTLKDGWLLPTENSAFRFQKALVDFAKARKILPPTVSEQWFPYNLGRIEPTRFVISWLSDEDAALLLAYADGVIWALKNQSKL